MKDSAESIPIVPAVIKIERPDGCDKTNLSIHALDKHTRDLAWQTFLYVEDSEEYPSPLLCESIKLNEKGNLLIEVRPECFEFVD